MKEKTRDLTELKNGFYADRLQEGAVLKADDILTILNYNQPVFNRRQGLLNAYYKKGLKVQRRTSTTLQQATNKVVNHFRKLIVDQKVDYLMGSASTYKYDEDYDANELLKKILRRNHYDHLDAETVREMSVAGVAYRLAYIDQEGYLRFKILPSQETIVIRQDDEILLGIHVKDRLNAAGEAISTVSVYDQATVRVFEGTSSGLFEISNEPHLFNRCPVMVFDNKDNEADFECVEELIDAYDEIISMSVDEISEFRLSYISILTDTDIDEDTLQKAKTHGCIHIPDTSAKIEYITKNLNDTFYENAKATIEKNIYKFSNSLDMSEESFTGASGEARKWKLIALENRAQTTERLFLKGLRQQFFLIADYLALKHNLTIDPLDIEVVFNRNLPAELSTTVDILSKLSGHVSKRTLLALLPFVDDVDKEMDQLEEESADLYLQAFNNLDPATQEVKEEGEDE